MPRPTHPAVVLLLGAFACGGPDEPAPAVPALDVTVVSLEQLKTEIATRRGAATLLNFWAVNCPPCLAELPDLLAVGRAFEDQGGVVLLVSFDLTAPGVPASSALARMRETALELGVDVPVLVYDEDTRRGINEIYDLPSSIPITLALDASGAVVDRHEGRADRDRFGDMMRKALQ